MVRIISSYPAVLPAFSDSLLKQAAIIFLFGIDTLDEIVKTEEVPQKLVYVTAEYTNTGSKELHNVLFIETFTGLQKNGDTYTL